MKTIKLLLLFLFLLTFSACFTTRNTTKSNIKHKFVEKNRRARKPKVDDFIFLDVQYLIKDSVVFDSNVLNDKLKINFIAPIYEGDINEGLALMREGDSLIFYIDAINFFENNMGAVPDEIQEGDEIEFRVRMHKILSPEEDEKLTNETNGSLQEQEDKKLKEYLTSEKITTEPNESGLYFIKTQEGTGEKAVTGKTVVVHYTGYFLDGEVFDSSVTRKQPFEFNLGAGMVIAGWDEGVAMMQVGDKARLIIPSNIAYGSRGAGKAIPPFTTIIFDVKLLEVK